MTALLEGPLVLHPEGLELVARFKVHDGGSAPRSVVDVDFAPVTSGLIRVVIEYFHDLLGSGHWPVEGRVLQVMHRAAKGLNPLLTHIAVLHCQQQRLLLLPCTDRKVAHFVVHEPGLFGQPFHPCQ